MDRNAAAEAEAARKQVSRLSLTELAELLQSRRSDWVLRDMALQRLLVITRNGGIDADGTDFKHIVAGLVEQIPDLRSQLARNACAAVVELSYAVGDHAAFDRPLREMLLPTLIDLVSNGNKVLANAGKETLLPLFTHCHFQGMLKVLATSLKESKHPAVKHSCSLCLAYALQYWPKQVLTPLTVMLEETLVHIVGDASADVRAIARQAIVAYSTAFSERSLVVAMQLDSHTRHLVEEESAKTSPQPESERHRLGPRNAMRRPPGGMGAPAAPTGGEDGGLHGSPAAGSKGRQRLRELHHGGLQPVEVEVSGGMAPVLENQDSPGDGRIDSPANSDMARGISLLKAKRRSLKKSESSDSVVSFASTVNVDVESPAKGALRKVLPLSFARRKVDITDEAVSPVQPSPNTRRIAQIDREQEALMASLRRCDNKLGILSSAAGAVGQENESDHPGSETSAPPPAKHAVRPPPISRKSALPRTPPSGAHQAEEGAPARRQLPRTPPESAKTEPAFHARPANGISNSKNTASRDEGSDTSAGRVGRSRKASGALTIDVPTVPRARRASGSLTVPHSDALAPAVERPPNTRHPTQSKPSVSTARSELPAAFAAEKSSDAPERTSPEKPSTLKEKTPTALNEPTSQALLAQQHQVQRQAPLIHPAGTQQWTPEQQLEAMRLWQQGQALSLIHI